MTWLTIEIRRELAKLAEAGANGQQVIDLITDGSRCAPVECDQLDYKRECNADDVGLAELCKDLVAFHNTFGGYIVVGVSEDDRENFSVVGAQSVDLERLKNKLRDVTDERILVTQSECEAQDSTGHAVKVQILFVPPRIAGAQPVQFAKDGPAKGMKGRRVFERGDIVVREGDECRCARGAKVMEIWTPTKNPLLLAHLPAASAPLVRITNYLPDRNIICPQVVGRRDALENLWRWLPDDLSHVKVLAGEGGIGKTSIAYEFSDQVTLLENQPFQQLVWLSAKKRQFRPFNNSFDEMVETHFGSYEELVDRLCDHLAITDEDRNGASTTKKLRLIKSALAMFPSFIVVDDVDSLEEAEQKQALEIGLLLGGTKSKILLTTRKNISYSRDICYTVRGLEKDEFIDFFAALIKRFPSATRRELKEADVTRIWSASNGSPLFSESILRLLDYQSVGEAIAAWNGESGNEVRKAALLREIQQLRPEARRILLSLAHLSEASPAELSAISGYPPLKVAEAIQSLSSLFLVDAPKLGAETRIRVNETTCQLVLAIQEQLAADYARLERAILDFRSTGYDSQKSPGNKTVAAAILQAVALERQDQVPEALETLRHAARKVGKDKRADLQAYMGSLYLMLPKPEIDAARQACRDAYQGGCMKKRLFESWFRAEWEASDFPGTEEVARLAIDKHVEPVFEWQIRLAAALLSKGHAQGGGRITLSALPAYKEASTTLAQAVRIAPRDEAHKWRMSLEETNDQIFHAMNELAAGDSLTIARQVIEFIEHGDIRIRNYARAMDLLEQAGSRAVRRGGTKNRLEAAVGDVHRRLRTLLNERAQHFPEDDRHPALLRRMNAIAGDGTMQAEHAQ